MKYRLQVERIEVNSNYAEELKGFNDSRRYLDQFNQGGGPERETVTRTLMTELTYDEFEAVKKAVLAVIA